jgi:hypothetical protein
MTFSLVADCVAPHFRAAAALSRLPFRPGNPIMSRKSFLS